ncbi:zinc finger protein 233-like isoform X1 [Zootermopsis nevadensis]|uniref:C2H2-type domain-containing protein n=1 Tax=Zootermopsis nevadensis TaxID=136037 RepID=A0A067R9G0_ZOONE|nr:zinc finger protein 233-like isoform X1 [Zootermopsis nevadensis]XP_021920448.1 zinc finger protein 233-like isoform X1 [Zootermopsis nevadensis]XP_021920449.1 zinc finger protein 233-like isoform X1 [Zootermopsis nevadensis]XP_021920450.1 zinc finger protein 233-like isoform X1 [Zootermopsis nevadensis]KDR19222.1 hypothetical protein L798_06277 [Zootermopsis nevadensis]
MNVMKVKPELCQEICEFNAEREDGVSEEYSSVQCKGGQNVDGMRVKPDLDPVASLHEDEFNDANKEQFLAPFTFIAVNSGVAEKSWNGIKIKEELKAEVTAEEREESTDSEHHFGRQECATDIDNLVDVGCAENISSKMLAHSQEKNNCDSHLEVFSVGEDPYKCDVCNKVFTQKVDLKAHCRLHKAEKPYKCDLCGKKFTTSLSLKRHCRAHAEDKPHKCDICSEAFSVSAALRIHSLSHIGVKTHKCDICLREFTRNEILKKHYITHTGEKPYKCHVCGKDFSQSANLQRHQRIHSGEKPYKCDLCKKEFSRSEHLKSHNETHV